MDHSIGVYRLEHYNQAVNKYLSWVCALYIGVEQHNVRQHLEQMMSVLQVMNLLQSKLLQVLSTSAMVIAVVTIANR